MKENRNLDPTPEIDLPIPTPIVPGKPKNDVIRAHGQLMYFSDSSQGFDIITHFSECYLHALPDEVDGYLLLPIWRGDEPFIN